MRLAIAVTALLALALPAFAQVQTEGDDAPIVLSPEQLGQIFCIASVGNDMTPIEAMVTPKLDSAIAEANGKETLAIQNLPDEMPPLGDGLPWRSMQDYADGCTVGAVTVHDGEASVEIHYSFAQYPETNYTDTLLLAQVFPGPDLPAVWRLDDIILANDQTFTGTLTAAFADHP
jgi:hypothetical protein